MSKQEYFRKRKEYQYNCFPLQKKKPKYYKLNSNIKREQFTLKTLSPMLLNVSIWLAQFLLSHLHQSGLWVWSAFLSEEMRETMIWNRAYKLDTSSIITLYPASHLSRILARNHTLNTYSSKGHFYITIFLVPIHFKTIQRWSTIFIFFLPILQS